MGKGDVLSLGDLIKLYMLHRNKTVGEVAEFLGLKRDKALYDILQNNRISADKMFQFAELLEMDLNMTAEVLKNDDSLSLQKRHQIPRMSEEARQREKDKIDPTINWCLEQNLHNPRKTRFDLCKMFRSMFYLLDVLLPQDCFIIVQVNRGIENYQVFSPRWQKSANNELSGATALEYLLLRGEDGSHENYFL